MELSHYSCRTEPKRCHRLADAEGLRYGGSTQAAPRRTVEQGSRKKKASRKPSRLLLFIHIAGKEVDAANRLHSADTVLQQDVRDFVRDVTLRSSY